MAIDLDKETKQVSKSDMTQVLRPPTPLSSISTSKPAHTEDVPQPLPPHDIHTCTACDQNDTPHPPISTWTPLPPTLQTFGYHQTLTNLIPAHKLNPNGSLDIHRWAPIFVYDVLQLPGSLATPLGKGSAADVIPYMTGAVLQRYQAVEWTGHGKGGEVQGIAVFGRGGRNRAAIEAHYGEGFERVRAEVAVTVADGSVRSLGAYTWVPRQDDEVEQAVLMARRTRGIQQLKQVSDGPGSAPISEEKKHEDLELE